MIITNKQDIQKTTIPTFPVFSKLNSYFMDEYNAVADLDASLACDLTWGGLFIWLNHDNDLELSRLNDNLILRYHNIFTGKSSYSICGQADIPNTLDTLFSSKYIEIAELENISEATAILADTADYSIKEDRDSFDYILNAEEQVKLLGSKFGKQRRKINKFIRSNGLDVVIKRINILDQAMKERLVNTMHTWDSMYSFGGNDDSHIEGLAINRSLINASSIPLGSIGIYINNTLEGFTLFQKRPQYTMIHHTKVSYNYPYLFDFVVYATISKLRTEGVKIINFEQDLGIPGLREHKLGLRPSYMLKKYIVTKNEKKVKA